MSFMGVFSFPSVFVDHTILVFFPSVSANRFIIYFFVKPLLIVLPGQWAQVIELARRRVGHCAVWFVSRLGLRGEGHKRHHDGQGKCLFLECQHVSSVVSFYLLMWWRVLVIWRVYGAGTRVFRCCCWMLEFVGGR